MSGDTSYRTLANKRAVMMGRLYAGYEQVSVVLTTLRLLALGSERL